MRIPVDGSSTARHPRPAARATPNSATSASPGLLPPQKSDHLDTQSVLALQRRAGNSSVNRLLRTVQRKPLSKDDDPDGYSSEKGKANVAGSGTTRREVHGLKYGISGGFKSRYPSAKNPKGTSDESSKTKQNPDHMAVVIMPDKVDPRRPVQVILHFTGYGFRSGDPYAGYTVAAGGQRKIKQGTVRDVDQEHWEQQIGAVNKDRATGSGAQVVAVLAQGRGRSEFGEVPTFDYVRDVFANVAELSAVAQYSIILSGHSGGGATQVAAKVADGSAQTADRTALPAAQPAKPGQSAAAAAQPTDLVVLFDAEGIERVTTWATGRISALAAAIKAAKTPAEAKAAIAASPKFRGYYDESGGYAKRYVPQNDVLWQALAQVPAPWAHPDPANPTVVTVEDLFRIVPVSGAGVDHEHVISGGTGHPAEEGALADALRASADPTRDRASGLKPQAAGSSRRRKRSKSKSKSTPTPPPTPTSPQQSPQPVKVPATTGSGTTKAKATPAPGWRNSDASKDYAFTEAHQKVLASQSSEERKQDRAEFDKAAQKRLNVLLKAEKKGKLTGDEPKELARLLALAGRIGAAQTALKRKDVEDVLKAAGYTVPEWYGQIRQGTFLNLTLRVHEALMERLIQAESALVADPKVNPDQLKPAELGVKLEMDHSTSDLRRPKAATGGSNLSMHTFGLAVDLNYNGNPFLGNAGRLAPDVVKRATSLVHGDSVDLLKPIGGPKEAYATLTSASQALQTYLSYRQLGNRDEFEDKVSKHTQLKGEPGDAAGWLKQIEKDGKALAKSADFRKHDPAEKGFIHFSEAFVLALTGAGLYWGGTYPKAKDIMHFDLRQGVGATVDKKRREHDDNT